MEQQYGGYSRLSSAADEDVIARKRQSSGMSGDGDKPVSRPSGMLKKQQRYKKTHSWEEDFDRQSETLDEDIENAELASYIVDWLGEMGGDTNRDYSEADLKQLAVKAKWQTFTQEFRRNIHLALRLAFCTAVVAIPPAAPWLLGDRIPDTWIDHAGTVIWLLVITTKPSLGATLEAIFLSAIGVFIAACFGFCLVFLCPSGVWQVALGGFAIAVIFVLAFDFSLLTRVVSLVWSSHFCMLLIDPSKDLAIAMTFKFDSELVAILGTTCLAYFLSISSMLFPPAIFARHAAKRAMASTSKSCAELFVLATCYYCGKHPDLSIHKWIAKLKIMMTEVEVMVQNVDSSWYECFDIGANGRLRGMAQRHLVLLKDVLERLYAVDVCASQESFSPEHNTAIKPVKQYLTRTVKLTAELLMLSTIAALDGDISEQEEKDLKSRIQDLKDLSHKLSDEWHRHRLLNGIPPENEQTYEIFKADMLNESFFVYEICAFARVISEYTEDIMKHGSEGREEDYSAKAMETLGGFLKPFKAMATDCRPGDGLGYVVRNTVVLVLCFVIGIASGFNQAITKNAAVMLSPKQGASMQRNLSRLQGTVLGITFGNMLFLQLYHCEPHYYAYLRAAVIFIFEFMNFYLMYSSKEWSFVGHLLALFGGQELVQTCRMSVDIAETGSMEAGAYMRIQMAMVAACMYPLIDFFNSAPASAQARAKFFYALESANDALSVLTHFRDSNGKEEPMQHTPSRAGSTALKEFQNLQDRVEIASSCMEQANVALNTAIALSPEAEKEPRYHKNRWPAELFQKQCDLLQKALLDLKSVKHAMEGSDKKPDDLFSWLETFESYKVVFRDAKRTLKDAAELSKVVLSHESPAPLQQELIGKLKVTSNVLKLDGIDDLLGEMNRSLTDLAKRPECKEWVPWRKGLIQSGILPSTLSEFSAESVEQPSTTMEDDEVCRLKVILVMLESFVAHVGGILTQAIEYSTE